MRSRQPILLAAWSWPSCVLADHGWDVDCLEEATGKFEAGEVSFAPYPCSSSVTVHCSAVSKMLGTIIFFWAEEMDGDYTNE
jgi:hypothetical protein